jgi:hypothetical protein
LAKLELPETDMANMSPAEQQAVETKLAGMFQQQMERALGACLDVAFYNFSYKRGYFGNNRFCYFLFFICL